MICPACKKDLDGEHAECFRATYERLTSIIARQRLEIEDMRERLYDAGIMRKERQRL